MAVRDHPLPLPSRAPAWVLRVPGASARSVAAGEVVERSRSEAGDLLVVERGALVVGCAAPGGREAVLMVLGPGDALGPCPEPRRASAAADAAQRPELRALIPSEVIRAPGAALGVACARDRSAAAELAALVARQAEVLSRRLRLALTAGVVERVHGTLLELAGTHGIRRRGGLGVEIGLPLTQDLLAALVGATRESVNRALRVLVDRGLVARHEGRYVIPGPS